MARRPVNDPIILRAFARAPGYHAIEHIAAATGLSVQSVSSALGRLLGTGEIVFVGYADQVVDVHCRKRKARLYGLQGTPLLTEPKARDRTASLEDEIRVAQRITIGRGSFWGAGLA